MMHSKFWIAAIKKKRMKMFNHKTLRYGLSFAAVLFIAGWITGMGGGFITNILSSLILGGCAAVSLAFIQKYAKPKE